VQRSVAPRINVRLQIGQGRAKPSGIGDLIVYL